MFFKNSIVSSYMLRVNASIMMEKKTVADF